MRNAPALLILLAACSGGSTSQPPTIPSNQAPTVANVTPPPAPTGLTKEVCAQRPDELGPVALQPDQVPLRRGTGVTTFADVKSSREEPIEVCMPQGERAWLHGVTCTDGSAPSAAARNGSVGAGGSCGSIIDLYTVTCPEASYEVFMDMYMCPPGEGR